MSSATGRKLADLRVCDLKDELERRSLEVTGNKTVLVERLQKALKDEGEDPESYLFEAPGKRATPVKKPPVKCKSEDEKVFEDDASGEVVVDEVGTVDREDENDDGQNNDGDMNDNEESINMTIEEDEQKLIHAQAQDVKDEKDESKTEDGNVDSGNGNNNDVITIKTEPEDDAEDIEESTENAGDAAAKKEGASDGADGTEGNADGENKDDDSDQKSTSKTTASSKEEKDKAAAGGAAAKKSSASSSRNLWVSGLSSITRASDLKTIFSKYGKVIGAKVVTNTRTPGTRCYGYVTMASSADASRCIDHLHRTELHGRIISVERTKSEIGSASSAPTSKKDDKTKEAASDKGDLKEDTAKEGVNGKEQERAGSAEKRLSTDRKKSEIRSRKGSNARSERKLIRSTSRGRRRSPIHRGGARRSLDRDRERKRDVLSFQKIREERERQRLRERERELREEERRRRDIRRRQREEEERLTREREKLRMERERLEREKAELLRLERERQKLEREKIELERLELKRQQMKIMQRNEDAKRSLKRPASDDRYNNSSHPDNKRSNADRRFEAPPPPRFDSSLARSADKKRDDYSSSKREDYKRDIDVGQSRHSSSNYHSSRDNHKDSRYAIPDPPRTSFRRDERDGRNSGSKRFDAPSYGERSSGGGGGGGGSSSSSNWHNSGPPAIKSFAASQMSNSVPGWQSKSSESSNNHWPSQDRYDRTYNERSGPYMDAPPRQSGMFVGGGGGGRPQDRYGGQMSRYDSGKY